MEDTRREAGLLGEEEGRRRGRRRGGEEGEEC